MNGWNLNELSNLKDWNIVLICTAIAALFKMVDGYRKGLVREVISVVSMLLLCMVSALVASGVNSYHKGEMVDVVVMVILFFLLSIGHHILEMIFFPAKLATKLPVIHFADKMLGLVFGVFEVVLALWTIYVSLLMMESGTMRQFILQCTEQSMILSWIYEHNYLAGVLEDFLDRLGFLPITGGIRL